MDRPLTTNNEGSDAPPSYGNGGTATGGTSYNSQQNKPATVYEYQDPLTAGGPVGFQWGIGSAFSAGWNCLTNNKCTSFMLTLVILAGGVFEVLMFVARQAILNQNPRNVGVAFWTLIIVAIGVGVGAFAQVYAIFGWINLYFKHTRNEDTSYKSVVSGLDCDLFTKLLVGHIMVNLCLNFAFWFFIIPGIILSVYWTFWVIVVISRHGRSYDGTCAWANALSESMRIVGALGCCKLFGTLILLFFVQLFMIITVVGIFFVLPFHLYVITELFMVATGGHRRVAENPLDDTPMVV
eukprot:TRINITY_DN1984_c0_g1_i1.p1 TRINITY_DN1984_c0_g1~~TRINITY_DN1984_c0_g1_i1.p1  ORF type:complete len:295 (+),score=74.17 TRINITY_DN1984_c0_g1_i1:82-966(+)